MRNEFIYEINELSFAYEGTDDTVLNNVSLCIEKGSVVIICGPSGCGKTTLIRNMKPAVMQSGKRSGRIIYKGRDIMSVNDREQAEDIGYIYQDPESQVVTDRVWTELAFGLESLGYNNSEIRQKVADTASYFGLQSMYEKKTDELSGGELQYLNLAAVLVMNPSVVILDEPISQLDPVSASELVSILGRLNRDYGTTIVVTAHRLEEFLPISTDIVIMSEGRVQNMYHKNEYYKMLTECSDVIRNSLPVSARIYALLSNDQDKCSENEVNDHQYDSCPFNVAGGRRWLTYFMDDSKTEFINNSKKNVCDKEECNQSVISIKNLYYRYPEGNNDIIKNLSLTINEGEVYGIAGSNGSGKSTLLSLVAGIIKPDHGRINISKDKKTALLPQHPELLFQKNCVKDEINNNISDRDRIITMCNLDGLLEKNPYSLSGGERQRTALAKVLSYSPDILLMDEPSKGLDSINKKQFIKIIRSLASNGCTVIVVSHDLEFLAECTDRCGMIFDGSIIAENKTKEFMLANDYYTTSVVRMTRGIIDGCVTVDDVVDGIMYDEHSDIYSEDKKEHKNAYDNNIEKHYNIDCHNNILNETDSNDCNNENNSKNNSKNNNVKHNECLNREVYLDKSNKAIYNNTNEAGAHIGISRLFMWLLYIVIMPATVWVGFSVLQDRKYIFISLLIMLESTIPFFIGFEKKKNSARMIVVVAVMCAIAVTSRVAFYMLPTFKPIAAIVIISGIALGGEMGFMVGSLSMLISNVFFGQGAWTPWQMFAMGLVGLISGLIFYRYRYKPNNVIISIAGAITTLVVYGGIVNISTLFIVRDSIDLSSLYAIYLAGLPVDLTFSGVTAVCLWFLVRPMVSKILRVVAAV